MPETYENYVAGEWRASETGETFEVRNPADTGDVVAEFQDSSTGDANDAIEAAAAATDAWADTPAPEFAGRAYACSGLLQCARFVPSREPCSYVAGSA